MGWPTLNASFRGPFFILHSVTAGGILIPGARVEEFLYEKLDRKVPSRVTNGELLAQYMTEAANDFGPGTPYGKSAWLIKKPWESIPS